MQFRNNIHLIIGDRKNEHDTCDNGGTRAWKLVSVSCDVATIIMSGTTCCCGRGCRNRDIVVDRHGNHDTVIEFYRVD